MMAKSAASQSSSSQPPAMCAQLGRGIGTPYWRASWAKRLGMAGLILLCLMALPGLSFAQGTILPSPYLLVTDTSNNPVPGGCVWTTIAGTSTPAATYVDSSLTTPNTNPIKADTAGRYVAFVVPGNSYKLVIETSCTSPAHGSVIRTQDNIIGTPSNNQAGDVLGTAGEALTAGKVVYLSDGQGGKTAGRWYLADSSNPAYSLRMTLGMTPSAVSSGVVGTMRLLGTVTSLAGLTAGQAYYLGNAGALLTAPPAGTLNVRIGTADSTTSLVLDNPAARVPSPVVLANAVNVSVVNTAIQTQILNTTIPANTLGTYRMIRVTLTGDYANGSGGNSTLTLEASYGGQLFVSGMGKIYAAGTLAGPYTLTCYLSAFSATTAQRAASTLMIVQSGALAALPRPLDLYGYNAALTVSSASAQSLIVAVTHSVADPLIVFNVYSATVELIGQ